MGQLARELNTDGKKGPKDIDMGCGKARTWLRARLYKKGKSYSLSIKEVA